MMSSQPSVPESLTRFNNLLLTGSPGWATDRSSPGQYVGYLKDRSHSWRASLCGAMGSSPEPMLMTDRSFHTPRRSPPDSEHGSWRLIGGHRLDPWLKVEQKRGSSPTAQPQAMPGTQSPNPANLPDDPGVGQPCHRRSPPAPESHPRPCQLGSAGTPDQARPARLTAGRCKEPAGPTTPMPGFGSM